MSVERAAGGTSLIDVFDRVLDEGIVIDAWWRIVWRAGDGPLRYLAAAVSAGPAATHAPQTEVNTSDIPTDIRSRAASESAFVGQGVSS